MVSGEKLRDLAKRAVEQRQVAKRLSSFRIKKLEHIEKRLRTQHSRSRLKRLALCDSEYLLFLEELHENKDKAFKLRVEYESCRRQFDASQSLAKMGRISHNISMNKG